MSERRKIVKKEIKPDSRLKSNIMKNMIADDIKLLSNNQIKKKKK
jgi:hypothetical protein